MERENCSFDEARNEYNKQKMREAGIAEDGYRLIVNCREHGGQEVFHLHMHLMGGRPLGPMLARR